MQTLEEHQGLPPSSRSTRHTAQHFWEGSPLSLSPAQHPELTALLGGGGPQPITCSAPITPHSTSGGSPADHLPLVVGGDAAHVVVHGGKHRDGFLGDVHARKDHGRL